jgi:hypothetical protein
MTESSADGLGTAEDPSVHSLKAFEDNRKTPFMNQANAV